MRGSLFIPKGWRGRGWKDFAHSISLMAGYNVSVFVEENRVPNTCSLSVQAWNKEGSNGSLAVGSGSSSNGAFYTAILKKPACLPVGSNGREGDARRKGLLFEGNIAKGKGLLFGDNIPKGRQFFSSVINCQPSKACGGG